MTRAETELFYTIRRGVRIVQCRRREHHAHLAQERLQRGVAAGEAGKLDAVAESSMDPV